MRFLGYVYFFTTILLFIYIWHETSVGKFVFIVQGRLQPFDVATIALAAAALVVTCVGVITAIVTIFGFGNIKEAAIKAAVKAAEEKAEKVAEEKAEVVATRVAKDITPFQTPESGIDDMVRAAVSAEN